MPPDFLLDYINRTIQKEYDRLAQRVRDNAATTKELDLLRRYEKYLELQNNLARKGETRADD